MNLHGPHWQTPEAFDDGEALWKAVCEHELEGVVASVAPRICRGSVGPGWSRERRERKLRLGERERDRLGLEATVPPHRRALEFTSASRSR
jgi:hypothetical protein